jgi:acetyl esterase
MTRYQFDPDLLPIIAVLPGLDISDVSLARAGMAEQRSQRPAFQAPPDVVIAKHSIPSAFDDTVIALWSFAPRAGAASLPGVVYIHGGGFVLGDVAGDAEWPAQIAQEIGAYVISVEYRLAPEYPYPAAVEDCYSALRWMFEGHQDLGVDPARIALAGRSAGAGLAAGVALMNRDRDAYPVCFQLLEIPELDDRLGTPSARAYTDTPIWNHDNAVRSWDYYLGKDRDRQDVPPYAAPARAESLSGLPPTFVSVAQFDPLRDEGISYASRLAEAGVLTDLRLYSGTFHGSIGAAPDAAVTKSMRHDRLEALRRALAKS